MSRDDLSKSDLYESVKTLIETEHPHIHLPQQKLYTLFSISFQYMLFRSTKKPGSYLIRIEDSQLADKLARKSKDLSTRRFMQSLLLPRKIKFNKSMFYLDFFHIGSWALTAEIPREKFQGALIVKNANNRPMMELEEDGEEAVTNAFPPNYYLESLLEFMPKTITIAYEQDFGDELKQVNFPFIKKEKDRIANGVTISREIDVDNLD